MELTALSIGSNRSSLGLFVLVSLTFETLFYFIIDYPLTIPEFGIIIPNMKTQTNKILFSTVTKILRPLVRIFLRNSVPFGAFADLAKAVYVAVATEEYGIAGRKQTDSRVSIITGLTRKEVRRLKMLPARDDDSEAIMQRYHRAARVISGWVRDRRFSDAAGQPAELPLEGLDATFTELVKQYSGDMPVRAILDELLRVDSVEQLANGSIRLKTRAYLPDTQEGDKLSIMGTDVKDLITTIDHNICYETDRFFQRKVAYDNLPEEFLARLRAMTAERGQSLLEEMDRWLVERDRDTNPSVEGSGRKRAGIGIYYFEEDYTDEEYTEGEGQS